MAGVIVGEATGEHVAAIVRFFWEAWRLTGPDAPGWAGASEEVVAELTEPEMILARLGGPERRMFLAWDGEEVIGFAATRLQDAGAAELAGIVVRQDRTGGGVGVPLLEAAVAALAASGVERLVVRTESDNERALGFYQSRGFVPGDLVVEEIEGMSVELRELVREI